ncbi:MAG: tRNA (guanosine(46)-N7)-methyltransferase TrmB, partial [Oscillospiraceae bacterium]|nr:tRNA (guanosine(46)-N7)-methyltransferase TrmB [Oscillospiraceae bacterium]
KTFLKGEIHFKTDDDELFEESFEYFEQAGFEIKYKTFDLHDGSYDGVNYETEHEKMFMDEGKKIKFLIAEMKK